MAWLVLRMDDNGNVFVASSQPDCESADELVTELEQRGHKQTYWSAPDEGRRPTRKPSPDS